MRNVNLYMPVAVVAEEAPISPLEWIGLSYCNLWCRIGWCQQELSLRIGLGLRKISCLLTAALGSTGKLGNTYQFGDANMVDKPGDAERQRALQRQFESLITTHSALISRICFSYATDGEDYNDLRQDVLINIWKGIAKFRGDASSLTWVYRVTLNTCVSTVRKRSSRPITERLDTMPLDIPEEREDEGLRERFETLHRLIAELSPIDKAIVTMWLDERSYDEIAEVVGMSKNNIGLRLHRIRERWRKQSKIS